MGSVHSTRSGCETFQVKAQELWRNDICLMGSDLRASIPGFREARKIHNIPADETPGMVEFGAGPTHSPPGMFRRNPAFGLRIEFACVKQGKPGGDIVSFVPAMISIENGMSDDWALAGYGWT